MIWYIWNAQYTSVNLDQGSFSDDEETQERKIHGSENKLA